MDRQLTEQYQVRALNPDELEPALKLILPNPTQGAAESELRAGHFLSYLARQHLSIDWRVAIVHGSRLAGAVVGIVSPGKTALVLLSPCDPNSTLCGATATALQTVEQHARDQGVGLLQSLIAPDGPGQAEALAQAGYQYLADLRYLTLPLSAVKEQQGDAAEIVFREYTAVDEQCFLETTERTYHDSLDCPGLGELRSTQDIITSHRHTGIHDPRLWLLAEVDANPIGVVLLTHVPMRNAAELVYVGIVPEARGKRYGRCLVSQAITLAHQEKKNDLILAVDFRNHYAMRIYDALGFAETDRRHAWIRSVATRPP